MSDKKLVNKIKELKEQVEELKINVSENMEFVRLCSIVFEKKGIATRKELEETYNEEKKAFDNLVNKGKEAGFHFDGKDFIKNGNKIKYEDAIKHIGGNDG